MLITICVATFKRPEGLKKLLDHLERLEFTNTVPAVEIVIADNECSDRTQQLVADHAAQSRWKIHYVAEAERGISYARNRAVAAANRASDYVAFTDDDAWPEPDWLDRLLQTAMQHQADAVIGLMVPNFTKTTPQWAIDGRFFHEDGHPTGTVMHTGATSNCLIKAVHILHDSQPFQTRFALTGGEDAYFFMALHSRGGKIIWCQEAVVHEDIPDSRATVRWICQRGKRCWASHSMIEKELRPQLGVRLMRFVKGCGLIAQGCFSLPVAIFRGKAYRVQSLRWIYRGVGTLQGLTGTMDSEYTVIHTGKTTLKI